MKINEYKSKYLRHFHYVPDEEGDGIVRKYLIGKSKIVDNTTYMLIIDYDVDAPVETWTVREKYMAVNNGVSFYDTIYKTVYNGKSLSYEQIDMMIELVLEVDYLIFED